MTPVAPAARRYEIRQLPGPAARRSAGRYGTARARLRAIVESEYGPDVRVEVLDAADALTRFIEETYANGRNRQYVSHRLEWKGARSFLSDRWFPDDGVQGRGDARQWRAVVTLRNGAYEHDIVLVAWRAS
jgi:hypothetical protein